MRIVVQRVSSASVSVDAEVVSGIGRGLCLLVGVSHEDSKAEVDAAVEKLANLRIFGDAGGKMNLSVTDVGGEILVVSQFTLLGDVRRGRRPSLGGAARPAAAEPLIDSMVGAFRDRGLVTAQGVFGAVMELELVNDGPVTLVLNVDGGAVR